MKEWLKIVLTVLIWLYFILLVRANYINTYHGVEEHNTDTSPTIRIALTFIIWSL